MPIQRNSQQKSETLLEFYRELRDSTQPNISRAGELMIQWINEINSQFKTTEIWGLTSLYQLILLNQDGIGSPYFVIIIAIGGEFYIEYLSPESKRPLENAYLKETAQTLGEAMKMLKIEMKESKGWPDSTELD